MIGYFSLLAGLFFLECYTGKGLQSSKIKEITSRSFVVGNNCFVKDGQPFRYVSGSFHYWRQPPEYWEDTFLKMRAAGLNAVQTYIIWNLHEREPRLFNFRGNLDIRKFFRLAQKHNMLVILRPGPYIDAEVDMGGLPYWLLRINSTMELRSSGSQFLFYVERWYRKVLPLIRDLTYSNGGPIIMAQIENEYGYVGDDIIYKTFLKNLTAELLGTDVVLFTTDGAQFNCLKRGSIKGTLTTVDFGTGTNVTAAFNEERKFNPTGPLVNSEFYAGWLDLWGSSFVTVDTEQVLITMDAMLKMNASFNFYMFFGGTNFGFSGGAYSQLAITTTYDYDAPLSEAGDPTPKYMKIRDLLKKYFPIPGPVPPPRPKSAYGKLRLNFFGDLFDFMDVLAPKNPVKNTDPISFEALGQSGGFVLYRTILSTEYPLNSNLTIQETHDRVYVFLEKKYFGVISLLPRNSLAIPAQKGQVLDLLVQNEGRICSPVVPINEIKGISGLDIGGVNLINWMMYPISLPTFPATSRSGSFHLTHKRSFYRTNVPGFYGSVFYVDKAQDTFLNMQGWNNGYAFLNGHNLGRYWPVRGPQVTLFVPGVYLSEDSLNVLYIFELENSPCLESTKCSIEFIDYPILNGTVRNF